MKKILKCTVAIVMLACTMLTGCGNGNSNGASSEEKAVQNFVATFLDEDIDGMFASSAPNKFWDYLVDKSGLTNERLLYQLINCEDDDEFSSGVDELNEYYKDENITAKDNEIEKKENVDDEVFSSVSFAMKSADIDESVEEVYEVEINNFEFDGIVYSVGGEWYYGPEFLIEDAFEMAMGDWDDWDY